MDLVNKKSIDFLKTKVVYSFQGHPVSVNLVLYIFLYKSPDTWHVSIKCDVFYFLSHYTDISF